MYQAVYTAKRLSDVRLISADVLSPPPSMDNMHWYSISAAHINPTFTPYPHTSTVTSGQCMVV